MDQLQNDMIFYVGFLNLLMNVDTSTYLSSQIHLDIPVNILYVSGYRGYIEIDERSSYSHNRLGKIAKRTFVPLMHDS